MKTRFLVHVVRIILLTSENESYMVVVLVTEVSIAWQITDGQGPERALIRNPVDGRVPVWGRRNCSEGQNVKGKVKAEIEEGHYTSECGSPLPLYLYQRSR